MIEVNLLPGAKRRKSRLSGMSLSLPSVSAPASLDRWSAGIVAAWIVGPVLIGWMVWSTSSRQAELRLEIEQAVADSTRYAKVIARTERLRARRDTIARKLQVIQAIDAGRYTWAHILDEVSRSVPDYTWLTKLAQIEGDSLPVFRIEGRTGSNFALTRFMKRLEASPFLRSIRLASTELVRVNEKLVHSFMLEAAYEEPPPAAIQTIPLFVAEESDGFAAE